MQLRRARTGARLAAGTAAAAVVAMMTAGCLAHSGARGAGPPDLSGTWDWTVEEQNEEGDTRVEREEWHLSQDGKEVRGYYDRVLTVRSGDGRPFECYQDTRYQKFTRFRVIGSIDGPLVRLRETDYETKPDPCDAGRRHMTSYTGRLEGQTLTLRWPPSGMQVLKRRAGSLTDLAMDRSARTPQGVLTSPRVANAGGVWQWDWRAVDVNGDERVEHEQWHLWQRDRTLRGHVDRTVRLISGTGAAWPCAGKTEMTVVVRRELTGALVGQHVEIAEIRASQVGGDSCDIDSRPLFRYEGEVGVEEMVLSRGLGLRPDKRILHRTGPAASFP